MSGAASELIDIKTAVERGYGSRSTLMRYIKSGDLPSALVNHKRYVRPDDCAAMKQRGMPTLNVDCQYEAAVRAVASLAPVLSAEQADRITSLLSQTGGEQK